MLRAAEYFMMLLVATGMAVAAAAQDAPATADQDATAEAAPEPEPQPGDVGWPRVFEPDGNRVVAYQPQLDDWEDHRILTARTAVAVTPAGASDPVYGAMSLAADTAVDHAEREVLLDNLRIESVFFPNIPDDEAQRCEAIVRSITPARTSAIIALDRIVAALDRSELAMREIEVNLDPPPITYSDDPAVLVIFMGEPRFEPIEGSSLLFAANTNWDLFLDGESGAYFMLLGDSWLTTSELTSARWPGAPSLPAGLAELPDDGNWKDVRDRVPGRPLAVTPMVYVSLEPAELIVTDGPPELSPIQGTDGLLYATNTESDLFLKIGSDGEGYYVLVAGRWFRAVGLEGPWEAATLDLPADFASIPENHEKAHVLASVPGTEDAEAAVVLATVPQKATVKRDEVSVTVNYDGDPEFAAIEGTSVAYAVNTPEDVLRVDDAYYCCHQGIWFVASSPAGPWAVATTVPDAVYTIPATSPMHHVTYVYVYDSTPETVVVGQTAGYTGQYLAFGLLMFGVGYAIADDWDDWHHHHWHYRAPYYSYGCAARYDYYHGGYYRASRAYGPYGGAGRAAVYNPYTGTYARGATRYGPRGGAFAREAYNPYTDRYAAQAGARTPYGSWGRSVVSDGDDWARAGHRSNARGTVVGGETSEGGAFVGGRSRWGRSGFVGQNEDGDVYAGRNGNVYKRNDNGNWSRYDGRGDWSKVDRQEIERPNRSSATGADGGRRTGTTDRTRPSGNRTRLSGTATQRPATSGRSLQRDHRSRQLGNQRTQRYQSTRSRSRPTGGRSRGGGRRR